MDGDARRLFRRACNAEAGPQHSLGFALSGAGLGALLGVAAAMISAVVTLIVKDLSRTEPSDAIVTYMVLLLTPMSLIPALPSGNAAALHLARHRRHGGVRQLRPHVLHPRLRHGDASAVMPYDYTRLLFAAAIGYFAFAEVPDLWTWAGPHHRRRRHLHRPPRSFGKAGGTTLVHPSGSFDSVGKI